MFSGVVTNDVSPAVGMAAVAVELLLLLSTVLLFVLLLSSAVPQEIKLNKSAVQKTVEEHLSLFICFGLKV